MMAKYDPPKPDKKDNRNHYVKGALAAIPYVGGLAAALFEDIIPSSLEKRTRQYMEEIGLGLEDLEKRGAIDIEELRDNEQFISITLQAARIALRTHQKEKLEALRNAALNSALPNPPEESLQTIFLNLVDTLTEWHIKILKLFRDPKSWFQKNNLPLKTSGLKIRLDLVRLAFPELAQEGFLVDHIWQDLIEKRLIKPAGLGDGILDRDIIEALNSRLGIEFLDFISNPLELPE